MKTQPFTYLLIHQPSGKKYYGAHFRKGCCPSDLWTKYFSSSKIVKHLIEQDGLDSFKFFIRKTFTSQQSALAWEQKVLKRMKVTENSDWLNQHISSEQFRCIGHTDETKQKLSDARKGIKFSKEHKQKLSESAFKDRKRRKAAGWKMPPDDVARRAEMKRGVPRSPEMVAKMRASKTGKKRKYLADGSFIMVDPKDL